MPELPEVETTVKGLSVILNQKISNVKIHTSKLRFKIPNNIINILRYSKISNLRRISKVHNHRFRYRLFPSNTF
jgi:Formamidopyrimidine-DNA glycosylase